MRVFCVIGGEGLLAFSRYLFRRYYFGFIDKIVDEQVRGEIMDQVEKINDVVYEIEER